MGKQFCQQHQYHLLLCSPSSIMTRQDQQVVNQCAQACLQYASKISYAHLTRQDQQVVNQCAQTCLQYASKISYAQLTSINNNSRSTSLSSLCHLNYYLKETFPSSFNPCTHRHPCKSSSCFLALCTAAHP